MDNFIKERNEALLSVDEDKLNAYAKKYDITFPKNKYAFWLGIQIAITQIKNIDEDEVEIAFNKIDKKLEEFKGESI